MSCQLFVGTSGWFYDWNPAKSLDWFVAHSGLNAIELNASFYRFPFPNQVKAWATKGKKLRWAVKVSRLVTHVHKFGAASAESWQRFRRLFAPLDSLIDCYLFQLPPSISFARAGPVGEFAAGTKLGHRFALEGRHDSWFGPEAIAWAERLGITLVSIDAPQFSREIYNTAGLVYFRAHGRTGWYAHNYTAKELREIAERIRAARPRAVYAFFNNDWDMLPNARQMFRILAMKLQ